VRSIEFSYRSKKYFALVRKRLVDDTEKFHVKIMNSELETLWLDHQVAIRHDGKFQLENEIQGSHLKDLRTAILHALSVSDTNCSTAFTGLPGEEHDKLDLDIK
jgi:hypothetical protein